MSDAFSVSFGVPQGSALSAPFLNFKIQKATKECHKGVTWDILYADDLIVTG